jgi:hypothetical protein
MIAGSSANQDRFSGFSLFGPKPRDCRRMAAQHRRVKAPRPRTLDA